MHGTWTARVKRAARGPSAKRPSDAPRAGAGAESTFPLPLPGGEYAGERPGASGVTAGMRMLAKHYGFTDEELDFIIHYDIKYRMGRGAEGEDGDP